MSKTFSHAGVSKLNGEFKVRFANDQMRIKHLAKVGHDDIDIIELKEPMTKEDAVAYLLKIDFDNGNKTIRACLEAEAEKRGLAVKVKPEKEKQPKKAKEPKAEPVTEAEVPEVKEAVTVGKLIEELGEAPM